MQKTVLLYFALLFWFVVPSQAQLTFSFPILTEDEDAQIEVGMEVANFTNVATAQFTFSWDSSIIEFVEIKEVNLPNFNPDFNLNITTVESGFLRIGAWILPSGHSMEDGEYLFKAIFKVIGKPGEMSPLELIDDPMPVIFGDPENNQYAVELNQGKVTVDGETMVTQNPVDFGWEVNPSSPNPFNSFSQIEFYTPKVTEVEWTIFDIAGKIILIDNKEYAPGQHKYFLEQQSLPVNGTYFVQMRTPEFVTTQKVDFIK